MRVRISLALLGLGLAVLAVIFFAPNSHRPAAEAAVTVDVGMSAAAPFRWTPPTITVEPGTTIHWTAAGPAPHTVTADGCGDITYGACAFDSPMIQANTGASTYDFTFNTPGVYRYYCRIHGTPGGVGQSGVVIVAVKGQQAPAVAPGQPEAIQPNAKVDILSPKDGETIAGSSVNVALNVDNAIVRPSLAGITNPRYGHYHLVLDTTIDLSEEVPRAGTVPGVYHVSENSFTLPDVAPGQHTLQVVWGFDNHFASIRPITATVRFSTTAAPIRPPSTGDGGLAGP